MVDYILQVTAFTRHGRCRRQAAAYVRSNAIALSLLENPHDKPDFLSGELRVVGRVRVVVN